MFFSVTGLVFLLGVFKKKKVKEGGQIAELASDERVVLGDQKKMEANLEQIFL